MTPRARVVLLAVLFGVLAATTVVAGQDGGPGPIAGTERLGPETGEPVAAYLRRAEESLPPPGGAEVWALVQLDDYLDPPNAAALMSGVRVSTVVLRVPLPGVQTALIFRDLPGQRPTAEFADAMRAASRDRARVAVQAPPGGRRATVAVVEAARLAAGCRCVLAVLVRADGAALRELAERPGTRAVHAAGPDTPPQGLAVSPLLPEQDGMAGPVPDDGPVPPLSDRG